MMGTVSETWIDRIADGGAVFAGAFAGSLRADPELLVDEWADANMVIPPGKGAEPGRYRSARTPYAREVMRALSPGYPCQRVVVMGASQLLKTQVGLNWIGAIIDQAPSDMLCLMPTMGLAKRLSARITKTVEVVEPLRTAVAVPRSRDSRNTLDTKEFGNERGSGTLYITTAGSAANLAEISVRYIYGDEIDRWEANVDAEGDPIDLAENRTSNWGRRRKLYYTSSPTIEGASRIVDLYANSDQRRYHVPCPHCGHAQELLFDHLRSDPETGEAHYACADCGALIEERNKTAMLEAGRWIAQAGGDGETVGFHLSALYAPVGWVSWRALLKQHARATIALQNGDPEPMQVFYNTRLARVWDSAQERTQPQTLKARAEDYALRTVPEGPLVLTAAADVQGNRIEVLILGWGEGLERWVVDYQIVWGDPAELRTWETLDTVLRTPIRHVSGAEMTVAAAAVDTGGHFTQESYEFCGPRRRRNVLAIKGHAKPGQPIIPSRPSVREFNSRGKALKFGVQLWLIGTDTAKDWLYNRWKLAEGPGAMHFSSDLPDEFYDQLTAERKLVRWVKGHQRVEWIKAKAERNEALDLSVYNLFCAHYLGLHKKRPHEWEAMRAQIRPRTGDLFSAPPTAAQEKQEVQTPVPPPAAHRAPRIDRVR
jgi:phage terminase large subunit GpA-like protein